VTLVDGVAEQVVQHGALARHDGRGSGLAVKLAGELVEHAAEHVGVGQIGYRHDVPRCLASAEERLRRQARTFAAHLR
jgi:hypothetical protein